MSNITLYFGSFNPIHLGHLSLAKETLRLTDTDEVWFIVSPQSPFKKGNNLIDAIHRLKMVEIAIGKEENIKVSDIELHKNPNSYTVDTLRLLKEEYPYHNFSLLLGEDNLNDFGAWKEWEFIISNFKIYVYPRNLSNKSKLLQSSSFIMFKADYINISSTEIRDSIKKGTPLKQYLPQGILDYIVQNNIKV